MDAISSRNTAIIVHALLPLLPVSFPWLNCSLVVHMRTKKKFLFQPLFYFWLNVLTTINNNIADCQFFESLTTAYSLSISFWARHWWLRFPVSPATLRYLQTGRICLCNFTSFNFVFPNSAILTTSALLTESLLHELWFTENNNARNNQSLISYGKIWLGTLQNISH